jgi:transcription elongation factor
MTEVRIGVQRSRRELIIRTKKSVAEIVKEFESALAGDGGILWLEDEHGKKVGIPSDQVAYVEILAEDAGRPVGFSLAASAKTVDSDEE